MRRLILIVSILAGVGVLTLLTVGPEGRGSLLDGLTDPLFGLDHLLALLAVGVWAGRLRKPDARALPMAFLAGMAPGFLLAMDPNRLPLAEVAAHFIIVGSLLSLIGAILIPIRLPTKEAASTVAMFGGCHGYVHGVEVGSAAAVWFGFGTLLAATALLLAGVAVGLLTPRAS